MDTKDAIKAKLRANLFDGEEGGVVTMKVETLLEEIGEILAEEPDLWIDAYHDLRARCYKLARENNAQLMESFSWLQYALMEEELQLIARPDGSVICHGSTYTSQTQSNEHFEFIIPAEKLALEGLPL